MLEIEYSLIEDAPLDTRIIASLLDEFTAKHQVRVRITVMHWEQAWPELFNIALNGKGPDVSHLGSTWISSLVAMNALRAFSAREVAAMGGAEAFSPPVWNCAILDESKQVWAVPWMSYIYVVCYRRDLLQPAGIDEESRFGTIESLLDSIHKLQATKIEFPWLMWAMPSPFTDLLHTAASWIWGTGGDFISPDGQRTRFNQPQAIAGLKAFFETFCQVPKNARQFPADTCVTMFSQGRAAALLTDIRSAMTILSGRGTPLVCQNMGAASPSPVPWFGGSNLVIWRHTQGYPEREKAAVALVNFLSSKAVQLTYGQQAGAMPSRLDALAELFPKTHPLASSVMLASSTGRHYPSTSLWRRVEFQLSQALNEVRAEVLTKASADIEAVLHNHLDPLAHRLDLTLKG